jgi:hypothetical protein
VTDRKVPGVDSRKTKPKQVQTLESLRARTVEEGECLIWQGYIGNAVPQVSHGGKVVSVRRLILELSGKCVKPTDYAAPRCGNAACVCQEHVMIRTTAQHSRAMAKSPTRNEDLRAAKLAAVARQGRAKINIQQAREIRCSEESGTVLAERYGIDKGLVSRIRRGEAWREFSNPFAGLGAR